MAYQATIKHGSVASARVITISTDNLSVAKRAATKEFGMESNDYLIVVADMDGQTVSARRVDGKWADNCDYFVPVLSSEPTPSEPEPSKNQAAEADEIAIREIPERGIIITANKIGIVLVNGIETSRPIAAGGSTFVWAPKAIGLPAHAKIGLSSNDVAKIEDFAAAHHAEQAAKMAKSRRWNNANNEGDSGYNPYYQ